jgi:hypothetical protein
LNQRGVTAARPEIDQGQENCGLLIYCNGGAFL